MMDSITSLFLILSFLITIPHTFAYNNSPVTAVLRGVIEEEGSLPISVFWYHQNFTKEDRLVVRDSSSTQKYIYSFIIDEYTGFYTLPLSALEHRGSSGKYCAVIKSNGEDLNENSTCESNFQWMYDLRNVLKFFTLRELIIPGTHDSAAYTILNDDSSPVLGPLRRGILSQTNSIKTQLMDGIRYLDFRPNAEYLNGRVTYSLIHNMVHLVLLEDAATQINEFMDSSKDIVIVAFKDFGKDHMHGRTHWQYTLNHFWIANKRLILSYDHEIRRSSPFMWPPITHCWSHAETINQLHSHLAAIHQNHENDSVPYATIVDFAYSEAFVLENLFNQHISLQEWSERLSRYIPLWYTEEWSSSANIVLVNFYQTSGIVDVAIQLNKKRADKYIIKGHY